MKGKQMPREESTTSEMYRYAKMAGLYVRTWSPGDGVTRYRFFRFARCGQCLDVPGKDGLGNPCKGCDGSGFLPPSNDYFGPENGLFTALGAKAALTFVHGVLAGAGKGGY